MEHVDTLITARWVVPVEPSHCVLEHHAVAIRQGRIVAVEPEKQAREHYSADQIVARPQHVLIPGLINAHTRAAMVLLRGATEIERLEQRWLDAEYVRDGAELAIAAMLGSGTTCFADTHLFPEVTAQVTSATGMRACIGLPIDDAASVWAGSVDEYLDKGLGLLDEYRNDPLITTSFALCAPRNLSDSTLQRVRRAADELDLPMTLPVNESRIDMMRDGERTLARLERLGLLSPLLSAVHMTHLDDDDIERAARSGISIVHCPQANLTLGNGACPIRSLRARGLNIALGAGTASTHDLSLLGEMRTGALLEAGIVTWQLDGSQPTNAHDWLHIATLGGARALGLGDAIGSLLPGKWADLCCIDLARAHSQPVHDPVTNLVHCISRDQVSDVWVAGRALLTDSRLIRMDLADLLQRAQRWQQRIASTRLQESP